MNQPPSGALLKLAENVNPHWVGNTLSMTIVSCLSAGSAPCTYIMNAPVELLVVKELLWVTGTEPNSGIRQK